MAVTGPDRQRGIYAATVRLWATRWRVARTRRGDESVTVYSPAFYTGLSVFFLALFVLNICTHGTALGLFGTGGGAVVTGCVAYRSRAARRRENGR